MNKEWIFRLEKKRFSNMAKRLLDRKGDKEGNQVTNKIRWA